MNVIDFAGLRISHPLASFCEFRGITLRRDGSGGRLVGCCPLHDDKTASFVVYSDGHFYCYGCGAHGDVTHLCAALQGITIAEAARKLNYGSPPVLYALPPPAAPPPAAYQLSDQDLERMASAAHRLATNPLLISRFVAKRPEWNAEAIENTALEGKNRLRDRPASFEPHLEGFSSIRLATQARPLLPPLTAMRNNLTDLPANTCLLSASPPREICRRLREPS
jgi:hypothetical protein